jgi:microcystin-dependent protein
LLSIASNTSLFAIVGTTYGGDVRTTFGLPDLRGRVAMHPGNGPGLNSRRLGEKSGTETNTLNTNQLPSHTHTARAQSAAANQQDPTGHVWASDGAGVTATYSDQGANSDMNPAAIAPTGGSQPITNLQPYQCVNFIIALVGVFPSRN